MTHRPTAAGGGDTDIAAVAALVADPGRCRILPALDDGRALPASRLAAEAGVGAATASSHLGKLTEAGRTGLVRTFGIQRAPHRKGGPMTELQVIARYRIAEGKEDEVLTLLPKLADASRAEPGNLAFVVYRRLGDDREVVLLERYTSREAFAAHRETPHFKDLVLDQIAPRLDSRVIETYDAAE